MWRSDAKSLGHRIFGILYPWEPKESSCGQGSIRSKKSSDARRLNPQSLGHEKSGTQEPWKRLFSTVYSVF